MIQLAYLGVHEIFQMALAAQEAGWLSGLQCSLFDAPGKWGRFLGRWVRLPVARPLGAEALPPDKVHEYPWPLLRRQLSQRFDSSPRPDPLPFFRAFETAAARRLTRLKNRPQIAVGAETCALGFFQEAKRLGMKCMLDCHGIPNRFLDDALRRAADEFDLPPPPASDSAEMEEHKAAERELADRLVFCSELQRDIWVRLGVPPEKTRAVPLWVDGDFWQPGDHPTCEQRARGPLRVAAVSAGSLAKGFPYLIRSVAQHGSAVQLAVVGGVAPALRTWLSSQQVQMNELGYMSRPELREFLRTQELLVMPSLGDSFGFVAIEAMACGLPVIVTDHCGVPVPQPEWRVPAMDADSLASRISYYLDRPEARVEDGIKARSFAIQFTPRLYRQQIREVYEELLSLPPSRNKP